MKCSFLLFLLLEAVLMISSTIILYKVSSLLYPKLWKEWKSNPNDKQILKKFNIIRFTVPILGVLVGAFLAQLICKKFGIN
jgi:hypothetical protein